MFRPPNFIMDLADMFGRIHVKLPINTQTSAKMLLPKCNIGPENWFEPAALCKWRA